MPEQIPIAGPMLGAAITIVGLLISWGVWRRKGGAAGLRGVSWSLLPLAAGLVGLMAVIWQFAFSLVGFFAGFVFSPLVWAGAAVAALAVVLWVTSGVMRRRGAGTSGRAKSTAGADAKPDSDAQADRSQADRSQVEAAKQQKSAGGGEDMSDIEDLLRKHGIE